METTTLKLRGMSCASCANNIETAIPSVPSVEAENERLIKGAESLELAHKIQMIVLDKTGTITQGKRLLVILSQSEAQQTKMN